jgi:hypothetical protein
VGLEVRAVGHDKQLLQHYIDVPWRIYRDDPHWVPPLKSEMKRTTSRKENPFFRHADVEHFVALTNGEEAAGRIAATVYPAHNERYQEATGFFGFFESVPDGQVAAALLAAAEAWLRVRRMRRIAGPYNYCSTQELGLLVEGFDAPPALFQPHNPPYYQDFLVERGYVQEFSMDTYRWELGEHLQLRPRLLEQGDAVARRAGLTVRNIDRRRFAEESELLRRLFNESFAKNDGVLPFEQDVFECQLRALKPFIDPRLIHIVEHDGQPVAFSILLPNLNELLARFNGRVGLWDLLTYRLRRIRGAVVVLVGAVPAFQGSGVGRTLVAALVRATLAARYTQLHTTWIHDRTWASRVLVRRWDATRAKRYSIFGRPL